MPGKHPDTSISLHHLSFEDAIEALAKQPKRVDSQAEASGSTTEDAPASETSTKRTAQRRESSGG